MIEKLTFVFKVYSSIREKTKCIHCVASNQMEIQNKIKNMKKNPLNCNSKWITKRMLA